MKLSRRTMMGTMVGASTAVAMEGPQQLMGTVRGPFPGPAVYGGAMAAGAQTPQPCEPSLADLRSFRADLEARARGEGFDWHRNYPQPYEGQRDTNMHALKSVSPTARRFMIDRDHERRALENYMESAKQELAQFLKDWAWKLF